MARFQIAISVITKQPAFRTEAKMFTDKIEVKKTDLTDEEIDKKLKEKLAKFMNVSDAEYTDIEEIDTLEKSVENEAENKDE